MMTRCVETQAFYFSKLVLIRLFQQRARYGFSIRNRHNIYGRLKRRAEATG